MTHARLEAQPICCRSDRRARPLTRLGRQLGRAAALVGALVFVGGLPIAGLDNVGAVAFGEPAGPAAVPGPVGTVVVNVVGVGAQSGTVVGLLFNGNDGFPAKVAKACQLVTSKVAGNVVTLRFADVPLGTYAVTVYHDVNGNQKLDTNWIGIPKEPVAVSNNAKGRMGPPKWKDAAFELREGTKELTVSLVKI